MNAEELQALARGPAGSYFSALIAAVVFGWQAKKWARWIPQRVGKKGRARLLQENKTSIQLAKVLPLAGLGVVLLAIKAGWMRDDDLRRGGLFMGLIFLLPMMVILVAGLGRGKEGIKETMVAYDISERTPPGVLIGFMAVFGAIGLFCGISLLLRT